MTTKKKILTWLMTTLLMAGLGLALWPADIAYAGSGLPERTSPQPANDGDDESGKPTGSYIELSAPSWAGASSVVQWLDSAGAWHDVEGWRGTLNDWGSRRWWVAAKDFGSGPFRWQVSHSAQVRAVSQPFHLPKVGAATLLITIPTDE